MYVSSVTFFIRFWQSVHPSELSIMGPLGSCGIPALWSHLRSWREWGLLGGRKNLNADLLHSTRTLPLFKRQSDVNYAHRTPIERYGVAGAAKSSLANLRMWRCASVCLLLPLQFSRLNAMFFITQGRNLFICMNFLSWESSQRFFSYEIRKIPELRVKGIVQP